MGSWSKFLVLAATCTVACGASRPATARATEEWLVVEPPRLIDPKTDLYLAVLATVFGRDGGLEAGCFHMVTLPNSGVEEVVYVDCLGERAGAAARIVRLVAKGDVSASLEANGVAAASAILVDRFETKLGPEDAKMLRELWWRMLRQARVDQLQVHGWTPRYYFSGCEPLVGCRGAVGVKPRQGSLAGRLVELGEILGKLTQAPVRNRNGLTQMLRQRARALRNGLDQELK